MNRSVIEKILRGLPKDQASVLYWKCQDLNYVEIGEKLHISFQTVTREMAFVYEKLGPIIGIDENTHPRARMRILKTHVCDALMHLIDGNPEFLERFPLSGPNFAGELGDPGEDVAVRPLSKPDPEPEILAMVIYDGMVLERIKRQNSARQDETIDAEEVDPDEYERKKEEERLRQERQRQDGVGRRGPDRTALIIGLLLTACVCVGALWFGGDRILAAISPDPTAISTNTAPGLTSTSASILPSRTPTPEVSPTSENTATPEITPTPIPLPIREDFNNPISPLWIQSGSPIFVTSERGQYDGVFTTREEMTASLTVGNTAWRDYIISLSAMGTPGDPLYIEISIRMEDINNRIILFCDNRFGGDRNCSWVVVHEGIRNVVQELQYLNLEDTLTLSVHGNTFTANTSYEGGTERTSQLILPLDYEGMFDGGGVMVEIKDSEVDFIEIQPFR